MKHWGIDEMILLAARDTVTCGGPPGCHVSSPEENGPGRLTPGLSLTL